MTTPADIAEFITFWRDSTLKERSGSHEHFIALCRLLGVKTPMEADPHGEWFTFEKGVKKTGGGDGWADVWRRHCFAWEYKGKGKDLGAALRQLQQYALALENPPLLIVSDMETIEIHTNFTNTVLRLTLDDLANPEKFRKLKCAFTDSEQLNPGLTRRWWRFYGSLPKSACPSLSRICTPARRAILTRLRRRPGGRRFKAAAFRPVRTSDPTLKN